MVINHRIDLCKIIDLSLPVAELGCAEGLFSADMCRWGIPMLYMVDNWATIPGQRGDGGFDQAWHDENYRQAMDRVKDYKVTVLRGLTHEMAAKVPDESLGMVYLDADHSYEGVMRDLKAWYPKVVKGGVIAGHDYLMKHYGVFEAVKDFGITPVYTIYENQIEDAGFYFYKP